MKRGAADAGKLFLIDESDQSTHQIFFDDNISEDPQCSIVDIRNAFTGEKIEYKEAIDKYMVQVEPNKAILDDNYFIKKLYECEVRKLEERVGAGERRSKETVLACKRRGAYLDCARHLEASLCSCRSKGAVRNLNLLSLLSHRLNQFSEFDGDILIEEKLEDRETKFIK